MRQSGGAQRLYVSDPPSRVPPVRLPRSGAQSARHLLDPENGFQTDWHARIRPGWLRWIVTRHLAGDSATCFGTVRRPPCRENRPGPTIISKDVLSDRRLDVSELPDLDD